METLIIGGRLGLVPDLRKSKGRNQNKLLFYNAPLIQPYISTLPELNQIMPILESIILHVNTFKVKRATNI